MTMDTSAPAPVIDAFDIAKSFPGPSRRSPSVDVLRGISLRVWPGEMVAIVGPSGSGKSTLLYCLSGLEPVTTGTVTLAGEDITRLSAARLAARRREAIGFVFQSFNLIDSLTARENIALPARLARRRVDRAMVDGILDRVGLTGDGSRRPGELSGGEQQRVAVARVLATSPQVVFADEPTGSLDTVNGEIVLRLLHDVADSGRSVILVTHDLEAAAGADRVLVLRDGTLHAELSHPTTDKVLEAVRRAGAEAIR
jgi:putative ABC transport system ATP-binding protein